METLLYYLLQVNIAFILLYGGYPLFLRSTPRFKANRAWLLSAPIAAFLLPLVHLPAAASLPGIIELAPLAIGISGNAPTATPSTLTPERVLSAIYLGGVILSLIILGTRYVLAWRTSRRTGDEALSFFGHIVIPADVKGDEEHSLLAHERVHATHGHSFDVLFYEVLAAVSWWNPLWRLALRELRTVHELQADAVASTFHPDYGHLLLSRALGVPSSTLINSFRSSNLKTRITMLNKTASRFSGLKYAVALPVLIATLIAVSCVRHDAPLAPAPQPITDLSQLDVQPEFPGGTDAMYAYLRTNVHYPEEVLKGISSGTTNVQFTVDIDGKVTDVGISGGHMSDKDIHFQDPSTPAVVTNLIQHLAHGTTLIDDANVRVVASMPDWTPGQKDGHAVATRFIIPFKYSVGKKDPPYKF
jgi:hypothetical protein